MTDERRVKEWGSNGNEEERAALARVPIFDSGQRLWGYEVCCVCAGASLHGDEQSRQAALSCLGSTAFIGLQKISDRGKKLVISIGEQLLLERFPYVLPPDLAVIKVSCSGDKLTSTAEILRQFKRDGYGIAVTDFPCESRLADIGRLADIACVSVETPADRLESILRGANQASLTLMAVDVPDRTALDRFQQLGFELFQGGYFKTPETVPVRRLTSGEAARFLLFRLIEKQDPNFEELAEAIQSDAALSFRLLSYLNSAAFGFRRTIKSILQSVTLLGWTRTRNWLRVALISDMAQGVHSLELVHLAAQRGKFLELLGKRFDFWGFDPDSLQLLGLFSLLDAMLGVSMTEAVQYLPLDARLKAALQRDAGSEYLPLIQLVELLEEAKWDRAAELVAQLGLDGEGVDESLQEAVTWANKLYEVGTAVPQS